MRPSAVIHKLIDLKLHMIIVYESLHECCNISYSDFRSCDPEMRSKNKILNSCNNLIIKPMDLELRRMIVDESLHDCGVLDFSVSGYVPHK